MCKRWLVVGMVALAVNLGIRSARVAASEEKATLKELPAAVRKALQEKFPKAQILKVDVEKENGVTVYDIEFRDGKIEKETDITAEGTMLEFTVVVDAKAVPKAAMKSIRKAAEGATIKRIEQVEISYEIKDGKAVKLPKPATRYEVEMTKGNQSAEVVVAADGATVEPAKWHEVKHEKK